MPEVFDNRYTFAAGLVPAAETFHERLARQFGLTLELEKQERGFHGAPRAYACLRADKMRIWIFWEPDRPEVEIQVDEPMERMIPINAAVVSLGGKPRYPDNWWQARRRNRTRGMIHKVIVIAAAIALAITAIWYLHWWGVLIVIAVIAAAACLFTIALARSFSNR